MSTLYFSILTKNNMISRGCNSEDNVLTLSYKSLKQFTLLDVRVVVTKDKHYFAFNPDNTRNVH